jgi:RNA polymerase-binding protein DksA
MTPTPAEMDRLRTQLLEERERVVSAIEHLHEEHPGTLADEAGELSTSGTDNHLGDMATATHDRQLDYTLEDNSEAVLRAIDGALARMDEGTYGSCTRCGRPIRVERLEALPYAELCIDCKREVERG